MQRLIVVRDVLVARCTALIPPRPHDLASVAIARRRSRSFNQGSRSAKRARIGLESYVILDGHMLTLPRDDHLD